MKDESHLPDKFRSRPVLKWKSSLGNLGHFFSSFCIRGPRPRLSFPIVTRGLGALGRGLCLFMLAERPHFSSSGHCSRSHRHLPTVFCEDPQGLPRRRRPHQLAALLLLRGHHQHHQVRGLLEGGPRPLSLPIPTPNPPAPYHTLGSETPI